MFRQKRWTSAGVVSLAIVATVGQWLGRTSGTTVAERRRPLPGDDLVVAPNIVTNHARTLAAPPEAVWPWLSQVGFHRAGWYTPRWVDMLFFPQNWPSARELRPELQMALVPGAVIPDGPPGTAQFEVVKATEPNLLVLHSTTHIPTSWRERFGLQIDWCWTFSLESNPGGGTRMLIRNQARTTPWWLTALYSLLLIPADHVMASGMLRGLDERSSASADRYR